MTGVVLTGLVPEGLRLDAHCEGTAAEEPLTGDTVWGTAHLLIRWEGVGVVRQVVVSSSGRAVSEFARGYLTPQGEMPPLEVLVDPGFGGPPCRSRCTVP